MDLRALFDAQRAAFAAHPPHYSDRIDALRKLEDALLKRQDKIIEAISRDFGGRAREETLALELFPLLSEIRYACRHLKRWMAPHGVDVQWQFWPGSARVFYEPLGVVGILSSWNYPLFIALAPLVGAIAAGNHVLLKPSELSAATSEVIKAFISDLYPSEYVSVVIGGPEAAAEFVQLPFDHLLFTGSARVAKLVMKAASENLVPVTLELGGKSPAAIHPTYPIQKAADRILMGKLYNAGQTCVAPDYVLVPPDRREEFVRAAENAIGRMYPALVKNPDYTHIANRRHYQRLAELIEDAKCKGATVVQINPARETFDFATQVFPPTLVTNVRNDMAIMQEEIFGPILPIVDCRSIEEAIRFVNERPHPLAFYYFDEDTQRAHDVISKIPAGGVTVNDCIFHAGQPTLAFGGVGPSGMGRYHGFDGFQTFSNKKSVFFQKRWSPLALLRPPYGPRTKRILNFLLRK